MRIYFFSKQIFYVHWNLPAAAAEAQHLGLLDDEEPVEASNNATVAAVAAAVGILFDEILTSNYLQIAIVYGCQTL